MHNHLTNDLANLSSLLKQPRKISDTYLKETNKRLPATGYAQKEILKIPSRGYGAEKTLELLLERYGNHMPASNGPRFWGFVKRVTTPASLLDDWLTSDL